MENDTSATRQLCSSRFPCSTARACSATLAPSEDTPTDPDWRKYRKNRPTATSTTTAGRQAARARTRTVPGVRTAAWVVIRAPSPR